MTHPQRDQRPALPALLAVVVLAAVVLFVPAVLNDPDTYWHLATGFWILDHRQVPHVDIFSYSRPGIPWIAHEWLSDLIMAMAWRVGGWTGLLVLFASALSLAGALVVRRLSASLSGLALILVCVLALGCMAPSLLTRPHLLALPVLVAWTLELLAARREERAPRLVFALLMTLWANLHGGHVFGFLLAAFFGLEALLSAKDKAAAWRVVLGWGLFGAASLVCCLITPNGVDGLIYPFQIMTLKFLPDIVEWNPEDFTKLSGFQAALAATVFVGFSRGLRVSPVRLLLLLLLTYMAIEHRRHQLVLAVVAPLLLAEPLAEALGQTPAQPKPIRPALLAALGGIIILLIGARMLWPATRTNDASTPAAALSHVPADLARQPVLNGYDFGGYLIFKGVRPFIDGRSDMYGNVFSADYFKATRPDLPTLRRLLSQYQVAWTIFPPDDPTVAAMDAEPGWRRLYADSTAVVHERITPASPAG